VKGGCAFKRCHLTRPARSLPSSRLSVDRGGFFPGRLDVGTYGEDDRWIIFALWGPVSFLEEKAETRGAAVGGGSCRCCAGIFSTQPSSPPSNLGSRMCRRPRPCLGAQEGRQSCVRRTRFPKTSLVIPDQAGPELRGVLGTSEETCVILEPVVSPPCP
jgi:hypothetical protein